MANPFTGIALEMPRMVTAEGEAVAWRMVAEVVVDLRDFGPVPREDRALRLHQPSGDISTVYAALPWRGGS